MIVIALCHGPSPLCKTHCVMLVTSRRGQILQTSGPWYNYYPSPTPSAALGRTCPCVLCAVHGENHLALLGELSSNTGNSAPALAIPCAPPGLGEGLRPSPWPAPPTTQGTVNNSHPGPGCLLEAFSTESNLESAPQLEPPKPHKAC